VVGTSADAAIAVDLAVRRPDLVRVVVAHEFPWRYTRHLPSQSQIGALARIGLLALRGRDSDAAETLLRSAYAYRDGGSVWDAFPEEWRRTGRENAKAALVDFRNSIGVYPSRTDLATVRVPVVCSYGARAPTACSASSGRSPPPSPPGGRSGSREPATQPPSTPRRTSFS
jgi:pimeloyl-ACP methyl ester carboxylesterase